MKVEIKKPVVPGTPPLTCEHLRAGEIGIDPHGDVFLRIDLDTFFWFQGNRSIGMSGRTMPLNEILPPGTQIILTVED